MVSSGASIGAGRPLSGGVRVGRIIYMILAILFAACVIVQVFLAGMAIFDSAMDWSSHINFVHLFEYLPIFMFIFAFVGRLRGGLRWMSLVMMALIVIQYATVNMVDLADGVVAAIHPVTGMGLFVLSIYVARVSCVKVFKSKA